MVQVSPIILGQYRPIDTFLHRLDTRSKMVPVLVTLVLSLFSNSLTFYLSCLAILGAGLFSSGVSVVTLWRNLRPILILISITSAFHLFFSGHDSKTLVNVWGIKISETGFYNAGFYSLRLVVFIGIAFLVTLTSSPSDLAESFVKIFRPLRKLKVPIDDMAMIVFIALRFIPVLFEEFQAIRNAQIIRGVNFKGSMVNRIKKTAYILIPVLLAAIQRADDLALAIAVRGYRSSNDRTFYSRLKFALPEWMFMMGGSAIIIMLFVYTG